MIKKQIILFLLIYMLFLSCGYNPMLIAFITKLEVYNNLDDDIAVTPVGMAGTNYHLLPLYINNIPPVRFTKYRSRFRIKSKQKLSFFYDWDDINFSDLIVEYRNEYYIVNIDEAPHLNQYHPPNTNFFSINKRILKNKFIDKKYKIKKRLNSKIVE